MKIFTMHLILVVSMGAALKAQRLLQSREPRSDDTSLSSLQTLVEQQGAVIQTLQAELTATKNGLTDTNNRLSAAESRLQSAEDKQSKTVAFTIRFSKDPVQISLHETLKFDDYITNVGGGYDVHTGIFTAPASGLYVLYLNIMSVNSQDFEATLYKEGDFLDIAHAGGSHSEYDQGTLLVTVHLFKGQKVWIQKTHGSTLRGGGWTVFSGYLIKAD